MIIFDIETTGLDFIKNGIVSIGAINFNNINEIFYGECRIDIEEEITEEALNVNGFSEKEVRDKNKQSQKELIEKFYKWIETRQDKILAGHNVGFFDINFLKTKVEKYRIELKSRYRSFDLCTVAQTRYFQVNGKFLLDDLGENAMSLSKVLEFCGIHDERVKFDKDRKIKEGKFHNAIEDCKLAAECFSRLLEGDNLFPEYEKFPVPGYLKLDNKSTERSNLRKDTLKSSDS